MVHRADSLPVKPIVSVLIPAFNREHLIADAIGSILCQSFRDFELIVVDDGSADATARVVQSFEDRRIRLIQHASNRGIPAARNSALADATGKYIAWLDSDDLARPNRLGEQLAFLETNPAIAMIGACAGKIDGAGNKVRGIRVPPLGHDDIVAWQLFRSPFQQSSIMGRSHILKEFPYRLDHRVCEDVDVFLRLTREHRVANLPKVLIDRRLHAGQTIQTKRNDIVEVEAALLTPQFERLGMVFTPLDISRHLHLGTGGRGGERPDADYLQWAEDWLEQLLRANDRLRLVKPEALRFAVAYFWIRACRRAVGRIGFFPAFSRFLSSGLAAGAIGQHAREWLRRSLPLISRSY